MYKRNTGGNNDDVVVPLVSSDEENANVNATSVGGVNLVVAKQPKSNASFVRNFKLAQKDIESQRQDLQKSGGDNINEDGHENSDLCVEILNAPKDDDERENVRWFGILLFAFVVFSIPAIIYGITKAM